MPENRLDQIGVALQAVRTANMEALLFGDGNPLSNLQRAQLLERELVKAGVIEPIELTPPVAFEIDDSRCAWKMHTGTVGPCGCVLHVKVRE